MSTETAAPETNAVIEGVPFAPGDYTDYRERVHEALERHAVKLERQRDELLAALEGAVSAYDEILSSGLPPVVKAAFAARFNGESARAAIRKARQP